MLCDYYVTIGTYLELYYVKAELLGISVIAPLPPRIIMISID